MTVAQAIDGSPRQAGSPALSWYMGVLADPGIDDVPKLAVIARVLRDHRLLVVLDEFEQNLTAGGAPSSTRPPMTPSPRWRRRPRRARC